MLCDKRTNCNEKNPEHHNQRVSSPYSPQLEKSLHSNDNTAQLKINNKNFKKKCGIVKKNSRVRDLRVQRKERIPPPGGRARDFRKSI